MFVLLLAWFGWIVVTNPNFQWRVVGQYLFSKEILDGVVLLRSSHWYHYRLNVYGELDGIEIVVWLLLLAGVGHHNEVTN